MLRDLSVRSLDGSKILGLFTPPAGASPAVEAICLSLAVERAESLAESGAVLWSAFEPVTIYREVRYAR